jgi:hypothetical protein
VLYSTLYRMLALPTKAAYHGLYAIERRVLRRSYVIRRAARTPGAQVAQVAEEASSASVKSYDACPCCSWDGLTEYKVTAPTCSEREWRWHPHSRLAFDSDMGV